MKTHGINPTPECPMYSEFVADFPALESVAFPSPHTVLLLATDAREIESSTIGAIATRLLEKGVICICAWGPDCQRVHDLFDESFVANEKCEVDLPLMSTWHEGDTLEEAVWYFVNSAFPFDPHVETASYVAVTVGQLDWNEKIEAALADLSGSYTKVTEADDGGS